MLLQILYFSHVSCPLTRKGDRKKGDKLIVPKIVIAFYGGKVETIHEPNINLIYVDSKTMLQNQTLLCHQIGRSRDYLARV